MSQRGRRVPRMTSNPRSNPLRAVGGVRVPVRRRIARGVGRLSPFRTPVRGHAFAARPPGADLRSGLPARLVREPENPVDPLAVAVWVDVPYPWRIGYLDRAVAARLAARVEVDGAPCVTIDGWIESPGGWRRPLLQVGEVGVDAVEERLPDLAAEPRGPWSTAPFPARPTAPPPPGPPSAPPTAITGRRPLWGRPPASSRRVLPAAAPTSRRGR